MQLFTTWGRWCTMDELTSSSASNTEIEAYNHGKPIYLALLLSGWKIWLPYKCGPMVKAIVSLCGNNFFQRLPNAERIAFQNRLEIRNPEGKVLVGVDFNTGTLEWDMPQPNPRNTHARTGLIALNIGSTPTFRSPGCGSTIPDVTLATESFVSLVQL